MATLVWLNYTPSSTRPRSYQKHSKQQECLWISGDQLVRSSGWQPWDGKTLLSSHTPSSTRPRTAVENSKKMCVAADECRLTG